MDNLLRGALEDDLAAGGAAVWAEVDNPVGLGNEFEAVLDDDDGVTLADEAVICRRYSRTSASVW